MDRQLTKVTDARGKTWQYGNDLAHQVTKIIDPNNRNYAYSYDATGALASQADPLQKSVFYYYQTDANTKTADLLITRTVYKQCSNGTLKFAYDDMRSLTAVGKPATAYTTSDGAHVACRAVEGNAADLNSSRWADPYPAWWEVDLEKATSINRVHVYPYWGMDRYCQYTVEVSTDGKQWNRTADMSGNTKPATLEGNDFRFQPVEARYVRVNMLYHSLNKGVHLVEVRVFPSERADDPGYLTQ